MHYTAADIRSHILCTYSTAECMCMYHCMMIVYCILLLYYGTCCTAAPCVISCVPWYSSSSTVPPGVPITCCNLKKKDFYKLNISVMQPVHPLVPYLFYSTCTIILYMYNIKFTCTVGIDHYYHTHIILYYHSTQIVRLLRVQRSILYICDVRNKNCIDQ